MTTVTAIATPAPDPFTEIIQAGYSLPSPAGHDFVDYDHHIAMSAIQGQA